MWEKFNSWVVSQGAPALPDLDFIHTSKDLNIPSDLQQDQDLSDGDDQAYDPLKEYYQMMKKKLDEQQAQLQKQLDKYGVDQ